jgi:hypothetical protein
MIVQSAIVLLRASIRSRTIVVTSGVDMVSRQRIILRSCIPRFVLGQAAVVTVVGPLRNPPRSDTVVGNHLS